MPYSDPEKQRANRRKYYLANREKAFAQMAIWRAANPERHAAARRRSDLRLTYGLTPEAYQTLHDRQEGLCAVCNTRSGRRALHVDHDHVTGVVRGLLCSDCNRGIGLLKDDPSILRAAIAYLDFSAGGAAVGTGSSTDGAIHV